ncbi:MAG: hypothetical protein UR34_C0012G0020 [candidate division WS6 bacterium GW2011_GWC1_33_20]|uniref:Uncharacterized protein n=2 Tax=Candidatus Dojkabacteria TaxID=74243 RepID=A0A0G0AUY8_9BACT|nr:MAG: hypothetical protein UR32_C0005G0032 [candidate division WS6 bacterium GW2011_GWE2_33_157]KKP43668.1 MAG: hypothetical protein UR34_C0012G0020 [candidate division WS6 bacterium GW2011_GWC1_33_20]KKP45371.1 MAG: hypothetical protein UR36_C0008G0012 [candidate division WS6 bacterium GW2011_GWF1_33_233]KKP54701.1 MAG: hypothetical protein UR45_C0010G0020 [candidate division WS6 bacterium GW2011_WS6_33_547]KKP55171.1 MAG: hypothetical protein UR47_C0004G0020 [candidate division WS6 bacteriu
MRQHPIPQNVLDVEFKLFTKFTLKEFAYLATGVSIGGIFLYLTSRGDIPGVIGIPIFVIFAGLGTFFALVPINDQPADKAIANFFTAINRPTQRVWLNDKLKDERIKPELTTGEELNKPKIIGASEIPPVQKIDDFDENPGDDILSEKKLVDIEQVQSSKPVENTENIITISEENISKYQFSIKSVDKLPGNINIWLCTKDNQPLSDINTYLKDINGKILYANKTGPNGYFLTNKVYPEGVYIIEFEGVPTTTPSLRIVVNKDFNKLPLRITLK